MYPKVKVRVESTDNQGVVREHDCSSLLSLKDIQFLSLQDSCFPMKRQHDVSPPAKEKIPKSYVPSIVIPSVAVAEPEEVDKKHNCKEEDEHIRLSAIPRPRAVLSSPDNDAMIGNKNRTKAVRPSVLTNHNSIPSRHARCKASPACSDTENPVNTMNSNEIVDNKSDIKGKKGSAITSQRKMVTRKPSPMRI